MMSILSSIVLTAVLTSACDRVLYL